LWNGSLWSEDVVNLGHIDVAAHFGCKQVVLLLFEGGVVDMLIAGGVVRHPSFPIHFVEWSEQVVDDNGIVEDAMHIGAHAAVVDVATLCPSVGGSGQR